MYCTLNSTSCRSIPRKQSEIFRYECNWQLYIEQHLHSKLINSVCISHCVISVKYYSFRPFFEVLASLFHYYYYYSWSCIAPKRDPHLLLKILCSRVSTELDYPLAWTSYYIDVSLSQSPSLSLSLETTSSWKRTSLALQSVLLSHLQWLHLFCNILGIIVWVLRIKSIFADHNN